MSKSILKGLNKIVQNFEVSAANMSAHLCAKFACTHEHTLCLDGPCT
jgi:hypothetical protein